MPGLRSRLILGIAIALGVAGCSSDDGIRSYTVPRLKQSPPRTIAAMIPSGEKVWFIKLSGPDSGVAPLKSAFETFVASLKFPDGKNTVSWTLPAGWRDSAEKKPGRFATFRAGPESLEVSITDLGKEAADVKSNVDRWRRQIGLKPVADDAELAALCKSITVDGKAATMVDMTGKVADDDEVAAANASPNAPPANAGGSPVGGGSPIKYQLPAGWAELPASGMRVAAFKVTDGKDSAEVTVIPLGGPAGGLVANVNRWRTQIGLPETTDAQLRKEAKSLEVEGQSAVYLDLLGKDQRTLGVIFPRGKQTWFIKFQGPIPLVDKERANFESFAQSVKLVGGRGS
jgi:hypothetical protein